MNTLLVQLQSRGLSVGRDAITLTVDKLSPIEVIEHLRGITADPPINAVDLALTVKNSATEKYDRFLSDELLAWNYASSHLDILGAWNNLHQVLSSGVVQMDADKYS